MSYKLRFPAPGASADKDEAGTFVLLQPGQEGILVAPTGRDIFVMPAGLVIAEEARPGVEVVGFTVMNEGLETPYFTRVFKGELFDGRLDTDIRRLFNALSDESGQVSTAEPPRPIPYGKLPFVPVDPGTNIVLTVRNMGALPSRFSAEVLVLEEGADFPVRMKPKVRARPVSS